ncbi:alpha/beta hydrolase [Paenibacillus sp. Soil522]|uniref:alpha/beta hydrolase n=1 Tax=Paenibacillus sp. Soil522 TaxID=1736388 RepID=UPI0006F8AE4E|nr:alpha/beta hydrolase-fold protein [Paenibacillus sp. Soil522]KRE30257.1 hypothetical protein ASG81_25270 [Paenibacillus sp. Soil522]
MFDYLIKMRSQNVKVRFYSDSLEKDMEALIYLPQNYLETEKYPVLYLLHGFSGNQNTMLVYHGMENVLDKLISDKKIAPLIVVAPNYEGSYGINSAFKARIWSQNKDGSNKRYEGRYEAFLTKDLIEYIDANFSTISNRSNRYIGGWSMGGYAAMHISFRNIQLFSKSAGMGTGIQKVETNQQVYNWMYPNDELRNSRDPLMLAQNIDLTSLEIYLNCGSDDSFLKANYELFEILHNRDYKVTFHCNNGGHTAKYIQENLEDFVLFFGN